MNLAELLRASPPSAVTGTVDRPVLGLEHDSRRLKAGEVFFAHPGTRTDGNRHVQEAAKAGAAAVVSELKCPPPPIAFSPTWVQVPDVVEAMGKMSDRWFGEPSRSMTVFGVTGTNGKTTVTYFLESIAAAAGGRPAVVGTVNYRYVEKGGGSHQEPSVNTTPVSLDLLRWLARCRDAGCTHAALEISSHALALRRSDEVEFDSALITNVRRDHLDFHQTPGEYLRAKCRLFELLARASSSKRRRSAVINRDDPAYAVLRRSCGSVPVATFGFGRPGSGVAADDDFAVENARLSASGSVFDLRRGGRALEVRTSLVGLHNAANAAAAAGACLSLGMKEEAVLAGLGALKSVPGRLESVEAGQDFHVFVDFAHTESALEAVLGALKLTPHRRIITVFGCGGERDRGKRGPMGSVATAHSDLALVTSDNPRGEDPAGIVKEIETGIQAAGRKNYRIVLDRRQAIREAVSFARAGDIVLIAGKGHETNQLVKGASIPFDDREAAREALASAGRGT